MAGILRSYYNMLTDIGAIGSSGFGEKVFSDSIMHLDRMVSEDVQTVGYTFLRVYADYSLKNILPTLGYKKPNYHFYLLSSFFIINILWY
jgi:hypothetical protein